jgi:benzoyl-CoA reductase/2-hydroxyglutaryl-CoA dehydratase subunit BcrC/BadD/HgdB
MIIVADPKDALNFSLARLQSQVDAFMEMLHEKKGLKY